MKHLKLNMKRRIQMAVKKFKFKVLYDPINGRLEGIPLKDNYGNQIGSAVVIADAGSKLPPHNNPALLECEAEMIVVLPEKKKKGEKTYRKKR